MGESANQPFQLSFNASLKIDFQGSRVTSDGGLILVRELDERLGFDIMEIPVDVLAKVTVETSGHRSLNAACRRRIAC